MATTNLTYQPTSSTHGKYLFRAMQTVHDGAAWLADLVEAMTRMIDGDGSDVSQFGVVVTKFGFPDNATAKAAWDELNSLNAKINSDASTDHVATAIQQAFTKFFA